MNKTDTRTGWAIYWERELCGRCDPVRYQAALSIETWLYQREHARGRAAQEGEK